MGLLLDYYGGDVRRMQEAAARIEQLRAANDQRIAADADRIYGGRGSAAESENARLRRRIADLEERLDGLTELQRKTAKVLKRLA